MKNPNSRHHTSLDASADFRQAGAQTMHLLLCDRDGEPFLLAELQRGFPRARREARAPGLLESDFTFAPDAVPALAFARQFFPAAEQRQAASINAWVDLLLSAMLAKLPDDQPWQLQVTPHYGAAGAGQNRCRLIQETLRARFARKHRQRLRWLRTEPAAFTPRDSLVQLLLTAPDQGWLASSVAPSPYQLRRLICPFPDGDIPVASDKAPPSRAFAKLIEAELRLGRRIAAGESCVDLGASPGSWSYVALQRGARVLAVDRAPLREDLMRHPRLTFRQGDAFTFLTEAPVDWLLCDVIAAPQRGIDLVLDWIRNRRARRFIVTIKFKGHAEYSLLEQLKEALPPLCAEFYLTRLCANKNEACVFGEVAQLPYSCPSQQ
jgi:23S rRNA (cytidine2498-2'-O)-methyltransferase